MSLNSVLNMRSSYGVGRYGLSGENDFVCRSMNDSTDKPPLIFCHAGGGLADTSYLPMLFQELTEKYVVSCSDLGGPWEWGNARTGTAITNIYNQLVNSWGAKPGKMGLFGISMGGGAMFNYARANPSSVAFVGGVVPMTNVLDVRAFNGGSFAPTIDAAYGGAYSEATHGPTRNTHTYRATYPASQVKTGIWYSDNDEVCRPIWVENIKIAQPAVETFRLYNNSLVAPDHGAAPQWALAGRDHPTLGCPRFADWLLERRSDSF